MRLSSTSNSTESDVIGQPRFHPSFTVCLATMHLVLAFVGCGTPTTPTSQSPSLSKTTEKDVGSSQIPGTSEQKDELTVAAASDLKFVLGEIIAEFERRHPNIHVTATFGSSGSFVAQISNQAPFDVFLSADISYPQKLIEADLAAKDSLFPYAIGQIVVWVPKASQLDVESQGIDVVLNPDVQKVAIANPKVAPYGRAAQAALEKSALYDKVVDRLVIGENIAQAAQFVETGGADVGIISLSLATAEPLSDKGRYALIPQALYPPIEQAGVILSSTKERDSADQFRAFLIGEWGQAILAVHGFKPPLAPQGSPR